MLEINFIGADRQGLQFDLMGDPRSVSALCFTFTRSEQVGKLRDGKNAFLRILSYGPRCDAIEQAQILLLLSLCVARALKGAKWTMFVQHNGRRIRRDSHCPSS